MGSQKISKSIAAAAIILMAGTLAAAPFTEAVNISPPPAGWIDFLPLQSQTLPAQKITLSYKQALTDSLTPPLAPQTPSLLKKQEIAYPTVYAGPRTNSVKVENVLFNANLAYLAAVNVADYFSTRKALQYGELYEANPIMRPFVGSELAFAAVKLGLTAGSFFILKSLYKKNKPLAWAATIVANLAVSYVVVNNLRMIDRVQTYPRSFSQ
jgi:hypothetical protein